MKEFNEEQAKKMSQSEITAVVAEGLSEVCKDMASMEGVTQEHKKKFKQQAVSFDSLKKIMINFGTPKKKQSQGGLKMVIHKMTNEALGFGQVLIACKNMWVDADIENSYRWKNVICKKCLKHKKEV